MRQQAASPYLSLVNVCFSHAISVVDELGHDSLNLLIIAHAHVYWSRHGAGPHIYS